VVNRIAGPPPAQDASRPEMAVAQSDHDAVREDLDLSGGARDRGNAAGCTSICTWCTGHLAASLSRAARAWACRAPAGPHGRHHGSLHADHAAPPARACWWRTAMCAPASPPGGELRPVGIELTRSPASSRESSTDRPPRWGSRCPGPPCLRDSHTSTHGRSARLPSHRHSEVRTCCHPVPAAARRAPAIRIEGHYGPGCRPRT